MRVEVVQRGGFAGIALRGVVDTAALPAEQAAAAEAALAALQDGKAAAEPKHPDSFSYQLTFAGRTAALDESEITDALRPVIDKALENAAP